jgi:hypothetical protein
MRIRPPQQPPSTTIERIRGMRRLIGEISYALVHAQLRLTKEQMQLNREVWASHESGALIPDIARVHGIPANEVRQIIRDWRRENGITIRSSVRNRSGAPRLSRGRHTKWDVAMNERRCKHCHDAKWICEGHPDHPICQWIID